MDEDRPRDNDNNYNLPTPADEVKKCEDFLQNFVDSNGEAPYHTQLQDIANRERKLLEIYVDDLTYFKEDSEFVENVTRNAKRYLRWFEGAAERLLPPNTNNHLQQDVFDILYDQRRSALQAHAEAEGNGQMPEMDIPKYLTRRFEVAIIPSTAQKNLPKKLREVRANDIGKLVVVKGMVTRCNDVKPLITGCTYMCDTCGSEIYQEVVGNAFMPTTACPSQRCQDNKTPGRVNMQSRGSKFIKYQELRIQELPDQVPVGHIPRSITIKCRGENTRRCGPGDIITVSGIFLADKLSEMSRGMVRSIATQLLSTTYIEACHIEKGKMDYKDITAGLDYEAQKMMQDLAQDADPYGRLASSIAPEIFGHEDVKKALLLQLVGGVTRSLSDGMKIRGDINICLMGDPGVAKSQLLKYISTCAPRGVYTTGKGSSGVGLTAAVVRDPVTSDLSLEGGALVLADMGICCIDEFDKMEEGDRTAIHEVMEQQTISIAKAGITTTLNARAAVLAAANPLMGRYNKRKSISENVDLPNSLLSRFDLLFLILDKADMENDLALSRHVLHVHKHLKNPDRDFEPLSVLMVKQYISVARALDPSVPIDLASYIVEAYVALRQGTSGGQAIGPAAKGGTDQAVMTARQLLSILRLSQALARLRMSNTVSHGDVDEAMRLTHSSKSSLLDDDFNPNLSREDVVSSIYTIMRDFAASRGVSTVDYNNIEMMVLKKGFSAAQLQHTLQEYESLGVLSMGDNHSKITFD